MVGGSLADLVSSPQIERGLSTLGRPDDWQPGEL